MCQPAYHNPNAVLTDSRLPDYVAPLAADHRPPLDDYRWLVGPQAADWLEKLAQNGGSLLTVASQLRKDLSAWRAHLVLEQIELRRRAAQKFAQAERMFFTPLGLEQATGEGVARYKAGRFPVDCPIADLCCGIGGDLLAIGSRGPTIGVDRDPVKTLLAAANCRTLESAGNSAAAITLITADVGAFSLADFSAWHLDPDRRAAGRRTTQVEGQEPGPDVIDRLLAVIPSAAIKLAPAADVPDRWSRQAELEWISHAGECRQLVAWFGGLAARPGRRAATIVGAGSIARTLVDRSDAPAPENTAIGHYLFEPDAAVLAARLVPTLCAELGLTAIAPGAAYLTGDVLQRDATVQCFEVSDVLPFDLKRVKALLRQRGIGRLEVKKRGVPHDPEQLRRQLRVPGAERGTLLITSVRGVGTAILARRMP